MPCLRHDEPSRVSCSRYVIGYAFWFYHWPRLLFIINSQVTQAMPRFLTDFQRTHYSLGEDQGKDG